MSDTLVLDTERPTNPSGRSEAPKDRSVRGRFHNLKQEFKEKGARGFMAERRTRRLLAKEGQVAKEGEYPKILDTTIFGKSPLAKEIAGLVNNYGPLSEKTEGAKPSIGRLKEIKALLEENGIAVVEATSQDRTSRNGKVAYVSPDFEGADMHEAQKLYELVSGSLDVVRERMGIPIADVPAGIDKERMNIALARRIRLEGDQAFRLDRHQYWRNYYDIAERIEQDAREQLALYNSSANT